MSDPLIQIRTLMGHLWEKLEPEGLVLTEFALIPSMSDGPDVVAVAIRVLPEALMTPQERQARSDREVLEGMEAAWQLEEEHLGVLSELEERFDVSGPE
jgi:hypothetical protein